MVDVAHIIPRSPDDPPRRRLPVKPWHGAVAAVVAAAVAGGLWAWKPWQSVELPASACWTVLGPADLRPLAGPDGKAYESRSFARIATPAGPDEALIRSDSCTVHWDKHDLLHVSVRPAYDGVDADRSVAAGRGPLAPLDFGPGAVAWTGNERYSGPNVRLYVRCDFVTPPGRPADTAPYFGVKVSGGEVPGASAARTRQAYADIALKIARTAAAEYGCSNQVQLPAEAPTVPDLSKEQAHG
ncbi:hypothetical protein [Kitasatospora sp. NPDC091207]|uniref:hypothetical protein n=1 Tax=Kitasatospora sp. NPDC091207 TaxID=3364083 RepID=UPI00380A26BC